jgi:DNA-binding winged helix-turn-helix (wHTH) protein
MSPEAVSARPQADADPPIGFGPFCVDLRAGLLLGGREPIPLRPKTWAVLHCLAERPGQLIFEHELLDAVWGEVAITDTVLGTASAVTGQVRR